MEVEFFIHGVPSGESFWGKNDDQNYFGTFYDQSSDEIKFVIQTRSLSNKLCCYYHYLVYKNVVSNEGRPGSYFGMSLRFDAFCNEPVNVYRILDLLYNSMVVGTILTPVQGKLKFAVPNFASIDVKLNKIKEEAYKMIASSFDKSSFTEDLSGFSISAGSTSAVNLYDCTDDYALTTVRQYGKLVISPFFQSKREKELVRQHEEQLQNTRQIFDAKLKERDQVIGETKTSLSEARGEISKLQSEVKQRDGRINELSNQNEKLNSQVRIHGQNKRIPELVNSIRQPVNELVLCLNRICPEQTMTMTNKNKKSRSPRRKTILHTLLSIIGVVAIMSAYTVVLHNCIKQSIINDIRTGSVQTTETTVPNVKQSVQGQ